MLKWSWSLVSHTDYWLKTPMPGLNIQSTAVTLGNWEDKLRGTMQHRPQCWQPSDPKGPQELVLSRVPPNLGRDVSRQLCNGAWLFSGNLPFHQLSSECKPCAADQADAAHETKSLQQPPPEQISSISEKKVTRTHTLSHILPPLSNTALANQQAESWIYLGKPVPAFFQQKRVHYYYNYISTSTTLYKVKLEYVFPHNA